jgi:mycoredoxin
VKVTDGSAGLAVEQGEAHAVRSADDEAVRLGAHLAHDPDRVPVERERARGVAYRKAEVIEVSHGGSMAPVAEPLARNGRVRDGVPADMVTMYTTTWCGYCRRLKDQLDREGIAFTEVDIERDEDAAEVVMRVNHGNQTVPTVVFPNGTALTNPSLAEVKQHIAA